MARNLVPIIGPLISQNLKTQPLEVAAFYRDDKEIMFKPIVISSGPGNRLGILE